MPVWRINGVWEIYFCLKLRHTLYQSEKKKVLLIQKIQITNSWWCAIIAMFQKSLDECVAKKNSSELIKARRIKYISSPYLGAIWTIQHFILLSLTSSYLSLSTGRQRYLQQRINLLVLWLLCFSVTPKPEYLEKNLSLAQRWCSW